MEAASPRATSPARHCNHRGDLGIGDGRLSSEEERMDRADGFAGDGHGAIGIGCSAHDPLGCLEVVAEPAGHGGTEDDDVASEDSRAEQVAGAANQLPSAAVPGGRLYHRAVVLGQCGLARARRLLVGLAGRVRNSLPIPREEVVEQPGQEKHDEVVVAAAGSPEENAAGAAHLLPSAAVPGDRVFDVTVVVGQLGLGLRSSLKDLVGRVRNALPTPTEVVVEQPGQDGTDQEDEVVVADAGSPEENVAGAAHLLPSAAVPGDRVFDVTAMVGQLGLALRSSLKDLAGRARKALPTPTVVEHMLPRQWRAGAGNLLPVSERDFEENRLPPTTEQAAFLSLSVHVEPMINRTARLGRDTLTILTAVDEDTPADQLEQQRKRCSKYSEKTLLFAITMVAACFAYSSFVNAVFKVSMAAFCMAFVAELISPTMKLKWRIALIYLSWFLLVLMSYLVLISFNKYYGYAIFAVPLPIAARFLHHKLRPGVQRTTDHNEADLDGIFDLSAGIVNSGGLISMIFGQYMVGPNQSIAVSAVGCLFFFTIVLGLYLMMIATVRNVALTSHAIYLAMLLKVLVVSTLIVTLIR